MQHNAYLANGSEKPNCSRPLQILSLSVLQLTKFLTIVPFLLLLNSSTASLFLLLNQDGVEKFGCTAQVAVAEHSKDALLGHPTGTGISSAILYLCMKCPPWTLVLPIHFKVRYAATSHP